MGSVVSGFSVGVSCAAGVSDAGLSEGKSKGFVLVRNARGTGARGGGRSGAEHKLHTGRSGGGVGGRIGHLEVYFRGDIVVFRTIGEGIKQVLQDRGPANGADLVEAENAKCKCNAVQCAAQGNLEGPVLEEMVLEMTQLGIRRSQLSQ